MKRISVPGITPLSIITRTTETEQLSPRPDQITIADPSIRKRPQEQTTNSPEPGAVIVQKLVLLINKKSKVYTWFGTSGNKVCTRNADCYRASSSVAENGVVVDEGTAIYIYMFSFTTSCSGRVGAAEGIGKPVIYPTRGCDIACEHDGKVHGNVEMTWKSLFIRVCNECKYTYIRVDTLQYVCIEGSRPSYTTSQSLIMLQMYPPSRKTRKYREDQWLIYLQQELPLVMHVPRCWVTGYMKAWDVCSRHCRCSDKI